jgi:alpha-tubulin suppressor-like RCC1 family protein
VHGLAGGARAKIASVSCGASHSALLLTSGIVVCFGRGNMGQRGDASGGENTRGHRAVKTDQGSILGEVMSIACGAEHSLAIDEGGRVWGWGWNGHGDPLLSYTPLLLKEPTPREAMLDP